MALDHTLLLYSRPQCEAHFVNGENTSYHFIYSQAAEHEIAFHSRFKVSALLFNVWKYAEYNTELEQ